MEKESRLIYQPTVEYLRAGTRHKPILCFEGGHVGDCFFHELSIAKSLPPTVAFYQIRLSRYGTWAYIACI